MGQIRWQWQALGLLAAVALLAAPLAFAADDTCESCQSCQAGAASADNAGEGQEAAADEAEAAGEDEELPLLDLSAGVTADANEPEAAEPGSEVLAAGVTVTAASKEPAPPAPDTGDEQLTVFTPPLWTPNSERFLLRDRQQELSLAAEADTRDAGDRPTARPPVRPAAEPAAPPVVAANEAGATGEPRFELPAAGLLIGPVNTGPAGRGADPAAGQSAGMVASLNLPADEELVSPPAQINPSEQFSAAELAETGEPLTAGGSLPAEPPVVNVIATSREQAARLQEPTLGEVLSGEAEDPQLGSQVPGISPWRSGAIILACLALLFISVAIGKRFKASAVRGPARSLSVIETISLGAGRQITIMEMGESALILGVTPQSINLLDKVPLVLMSGSYQSAVKAIIDKESQALPSDWAQRPVFTIPADREAPRLAPPLSGAATYGPGGRRVNVSELRRRRARSIGAGGTSYGRPAAARVGGDARTKAELIGRLREQLSRLEE